MPMWLRLLILRFVIWRAGGIKPFMDMCQKNGIGTGYFTGKDGVKRRVWGKE